MEPDDPFQSLAGKMLIAMPQMPDPRFARAVVFLCAHTPEAAMGLVVNKEFKGVEFTELLAHLDIKPGPEALSRRVHVGGPMEQGRGFVLHSTDMLREESLVVTPEVALTGSVDLLRAVAVNEGPDSALFALGYAGWGPGQLDEEMGQNGWLHADPDLAILFDDDLDTKWLRALNRLGLDLSSLSGEAGRA